MKEKIKNAAIELAKEIGLVNLTRRAVCERAEVADGAFTAIMGESFTDMVSAMSASGDLPVGVPDSRQRVNAGIRRKQLLNIAIEQAAETCYDAITREKVAKAVGLSPALVNYYFNTTEELREEVLREAIATRHLGIIAQGFVKKEPLVCDHATDELIDEALEYIKGV